MTDATQPAGGDPGAPPVVTIYTTSMCPYCVRAERLLAAKGVADIVKVRVDLDPERRAEMMTRTGRRTVPQIYVGDLHVGGFDDLAALDRAGKLVPLLKGPPDGGAGGPGAVE